ncbi:hypothetical protein EJ06DRAFT_530083 [Trichodelitschia bisporula]|uniref:Uncharacterized protein n=1 Tax=Trichodelitschia bisporula TaxID=703511 RepID=A0A6G1HY69_9PEZI|nr:hypothetical protein EJ06DRAFT_530083 [Trichodelitschia bisporula]
MDTRSPEAPDQLVDQLVKGYDALSAELKLLQEQRRELENKLSWSKQQYLDALKRFTPEKASKDFHTFLTELDEAGALRQEDQVEWLEVMSKSPDPDRQSRVYIIQRAEGAKEKIKHRRTTEQGVRIWNGKSADPVEHDFTTPGTPGPLKCPFASSTSRANSTAPVSPHRRNGVATPRSSMSRVSLPGRRSKRSSFHDPIRAEICGHEPAASAPSAEGSVPLCPIRFLNQHSPEEVAVYFEKHKHELPRSHELCVKRYQTNEESIRRLDAKYGNLVTMIQGLGQKHQPMLPEKPDDEDIAVEDAPNDMEKVKDWANSVSPGLVDEEQAVNDDNRVDQERQSRFDRTLKDVRVGESPSRPWGIPVPARYQGARSVGSAKSAGTASPFETREAADGGLKEQKAPGKCPFNFQKTTIAAAPPASSMAPSEPLLTQPIPHADPRDPPPPDHKIRAAEPHPQVIFNGPVFIGYPAEQALAFLRQSGLGGNI